MRHEEWERSVRFLEKQYLIVHMKCVECEKWNVDIFERLVSGGIRELNRW